MLYTLDEREDYANVLAAIDGYAEGFGISNLSIDLQSVEGILRGMRQDFPALGGSKMASPFKKAANFLCYFVAAAPVKNPFSPEIIGPEISKVYNHQNVMIGLHIAIDALHGAKIQRADGEIVLSERIRLSKHSYTDTVQALAGLTVASHFHLVSVFLELLCYRVNPEASYDMDC